MVEVEVGGEPETSKGGDASSQAPPVVEVAVGGEPEACKGGDASSEQAHKLGAQESGAHAIGSGNEQAQTGNARSRGADPPGEGAARQKLKEVFSQVVQPSGLNRKCRQKDISGGGSELEPTFTGDGRAEKACSQ